MQRISIIIPTRNEAACIGPCLKALSALRRRGHEVIVVDGHSTDGTWKQLPGGVDRRLRAGPGRAVQMNAGAAVATGDILLFLHADTRLPRQADALIMDACAAMPAWGRFDVRLSGQERVFRLIEWCMNRRSRWTGIATGDQALFVGRELFDKVGGYARIPLMEDVALSSALRRHVRPICVPYTALTSSRRWEEHGVWRTILLMWALRLGYFLGLSPARLARYYHG